MNVSLSLPVADASQVAEVRRQAALLARRNGLAENQVAALSIIITEAATNLLKHAGGGELVLRDIGSQDSPGIEVLALDRGPGIPDVAAALRDGHSTAGSPGTGLGAMARLATEFEIHSARGVGTAILARLRPGAEPPGSLDVGAVCVAKPGQEVCGDCWETHERPDRSLILVGDGLGHGTDACAAAREAVRVFLENAGHGPAVIIEIAHTVLRSTRGAVLGVAEIDLQQRVLRYAGVGNIAGAIIGPGDERHLVSLNGTVGHDVRKVKEFSYPWPAEGLLVLHSDGVSTHWTLDPRAAALHPALGAGILYRDHRRGNDDATMVVVREKKQAP